MSFKPLSAFADQACEKLGDHADPAGLGEIGVNGQPDPLIDAKIALQANKVVLPRDEMRQNGQSDTCDGGGNLR